MHPAIALPIIIDVAKIAQSVMVTSIRALYGTARSINDFLNNHIEEMQKSENHTVSRTGSVLEMAKYGFGIGFITPVVVIATGQLILGNPLAAIGTVVTAPINPIAMTCAAVGAIYYGWNVLTDQEKNEILAKLSEGLKIGIEMIKSIIQFVIDKTKEIWVSENLVEIKRNISSAAKFFGKKLSEVTHKFVDILSDTGDSMKTMADDVIANTGDLVFDAYDAIKEKGGKAVDLAADVYISVKEQGGKAVESISKSVTKVKKDTLVRDESITVAKMRQKLTSNGQLTIPLELRQQLGISPNSEVELVIDGYNVTLRKADS